jgi:4-amino-4-deoxy-L-arabinose transferase-like glycosyltransferase
VTAVRFRIEMIGVAMVAGAIQLRFIDATAPRPGLGPNSPLVSAGLSPDGRFARAQAFWMVRGFWFVNPSRLDPSAPARSASALHPPLNSLLLTAADAAGATGVTAQRVILALIFVAAVVVAGLTVRLLAGDRAAILAAAILATFPALWVNPATLGPETLVIAVTCLLLFGAARFWASPSASGSAEIGAYLGLAILTRTDLVALVVLVALPLALLVRAIPWNTRVRYFGIMLVLAAVIVAPWAARNLATFDRTTVVSNDAGSIWAGADCAAGFNGNLAGWWSPKCVAEATPPAPAASAAPSAAGDESVQAAALGTAGHVYAREHPASLVRVGFIRIGRLWNVYDPLGQAKLEASVGRPVWVSDLGLWYFYALVPLAAAGVVALHRRRDLLFPFVALIGLATLTALLAYGDARFRVEADMAMAMLAGIGLSALWGRARAGARSGGLFAFALRTPGHAPAHARSRTRARSGGDPEPLEVAP